MLFRSTCTRTAGEPGRPWCSGVGAKSTGDTEPVHSFVWGFQAKRPIMALHRGLIQGSPSWKGQLQSFQDLWLTDILNQRFFTALSHGEHVSEDQDGGQLLLSSPQ